MSHSEAFILINLERTCLVKYFLYVGLNSLYLAAERNNPYDIPNLVDASYRLLVAVLYKVRP